MLKVGRASRCCLAAVCAVVVCEVAMADVSGQQPDHGLTIVVHPETEIGSITRAELSKIFLKRLRTWKSGERAVPVDQLLGSPIRQVFSEHVHHRSVINVEVFWKRMIFSGRDVPPLELASDEEVLEYVRETPGAVGYLSSGDLDGVGRIELED